MARECGAKDRWWGQRVICYRSWGAWMVQKRSRAHWKRACEEGKREYCWKEGGVNSSVAEEKGTEKGKEQRRVEEG